MIVQLRYCHPDDPDRDPVRDQSWGLPARIDEDYPFMDMDLELLDGTAAGGMWLTFKIVRCIDDRLVDRTICCSAEPLPAGSGYECRYDATMTWDDGFISNTDDETLGYCSYSPPDGTGTPMGGEVIDALDGMSFRMRELTNEFTNTDPAPPGVLFEYRFDEAVDEGDADVVHVLLGEDVIGHAVNVTGSEVMEAAVGIASRSLPPGTDFWLYDEAERGWWPCRSTPDGWEELGDPIATDDLPEGVRP